MIAVAAALATAGGLVVAFGDARSHDPINMPNAAAPSISAAVARIASIAPAATPSAVTWTVTPAGGPPGTVFRFRFAGLRANRVYVAELLPAPRGEGHGWSGTVPADGVVVLTWQSPPDAPTGVWKIGLSDGRLTIASFEIAR